MLITSKLLIAAAGLFVLGGNTNEPVQEWTSRVDARLSRAIAFDQGTMPAHLYGVTGVSFRVGDDNRATDVRVVQSSGNAWLDSRAMGKVRMIRLPDAPESLQGKTILAIVEQGQRPDTVGRVEVTRAEAIDALRGGHDAVVTIGDDGTD